MKNIGKNIRQLRMAKGMTQEALAQALFVTRQTVSNYETGRSRPDVQMLMDIAAALGTDVNCVLYGAPVCEGKRTAQRRLLTGGTILLALLLADLAAHILTSAGGQQYEFAPALLVNLLLDPLLLLVAGWCTLQAAAVFFGARPLRGAWTRRARRGLAVFIVADFLLQCPFFIWLIAVCIQSAGGSAYSLSFPYVPVYFEILDVLQKIGLHATAVYGFAGALAWALGFPQKSEKPEDAAQ